MPDPASPARLEIERVPCRADNYVWLVRAPDSGDVAVVDPCDAEPVAARLDALGWHPRWILNTHHHGDHVGGNVELKRRYGARVVAPDADRHRIPALDVGVRAGDHVRLGPHVATVLETPGHTSGHVAFWFSGDEALFCGDTLFALGCGRLFEGTPAQMWASLQALRALPPSTRVFCAHEYTAANARFALTIDGDNADLLARARSVADARQRGEATVPSLLADELATNPFLRADEPALAHNVGVVPGDPVAAFAAMRRRKDAF
ncbi:MAG: hydroxyacylglutathione hydrolase [Planctomycetota bacterium]